MQPPTDEIIAAVNERAPKSWIKTWSARLLLSSRSGPTRGVIFVGLVVLGTFSWAFVRETRLIRARPIESWTEDVSADCAVVLTGGPNRTREGFDLLSRSQVQKLIISGVHPDAELREIIPIWPYQGDLRERDVILERRSRTTYGNAQQSLALIEALRCRDIVLVTSRSHMRRALATFKAEFPEDFPILPRAVVSTSAEPPRAEVVTEALKSLFYSFWAY